MDKDMSIAQQPDKSIDHLKLVWAATDRYQHKFATKPSPPRRVWQYISDAVADSSSNRCYTHQNVLSSPGRSLLTLYVMMLRQELFTWWISVVCVHWQSENHKKVALLLLLDQKWVILDTIAHVGTICLTDYERDYWKHDIRPVWSSFFNESEDMSFDQ